MQNGLGPFDKSYPRLYASPGHGPLKREHSDDLLQAGERGKTAQTNNEKIDQQISKIMRENNGNIFEVRQEKGRDPTACHAEPQGTNLLLRQYSALSKQDGGHRFPQYIGLYGLEHRAPLRSGSAQG